MAIYPYLTDFGTIKISIMSKYDINYFFVLKGHNFAF